MDKIKTSTKQKKSLESTHKFKLKKDSRLIPYSPLKQLLNEDFIALAIWECLKNNDPEGVVEIVESHLEAVNIQKRSKEENLPRSTLYNALHKKNPTIKTLAKMIHCFN